MLPQTRRATRPRTSSRFSLRAGAPSPAELERLALLGGRLGRRECRCHHARSADRWCRRLPRDERAGGARRLTGFIGSASGGELTPVTVLEPDVLLHATPKFLRDGRRFMFLEWSFDERRRDACVALPEPTTVRCLGLQTHFFGGLTDHHIVYSSERRLLVHPFDAATATPTGQPVVVSERIAEDRLGRISVSVAREPAPRWRRGRHDHDVAGPVELAAGSRSVT